MPIRALYEIINLPPQLAQQISLLAVLCAVALLELRRAHLQFNLAEDIVAFAEFRFDEIERSSALRCLFLK